MVQLKAKGENMLLVFDENNIIGKNYILSDRISKTGKPAISWSFKSGEELKIIQPGLYIGGVDKNNPYNKYAFACYLFAKEEFEGRINISFYNKEKKECEFDLTAGFTGWRYIRMLFSDMQGTASEDIDSIVITPSGEGSVVIDEVVTNFCDERMVSASYQLTFLAEPRYPDIRFSPRGFKTGDNADGALIPDTQLKDCFKSVDFDDGVIITRLAEYVVNEFVPDDFEAVIDEFKKFNIRKESDGLYRGERIEAPTQRAMLIGTGEENNFISLRKCSDVARDLAVVYKLTGDKRYLDFYFDLLGYMLQCGVYEGSVLGARHIIDYALRPLYMSFHVMAYEIRERGLADEVSRLCMWYCRMVKQGAYKGMYVYRATADDFNNDAIGFAAGALLIPDKKKASVWLMVLKDWLDRNMSPAPGVLGIFKEDGCVYHHCGHYPGYGMPALVGVLPIVWALTGTPFAIEKESWSNIRKALEILKFSSSSGRAGVAGSIPLSFAGRNVNVYQSLDDKPFKYFALASHFYNDAPIEEEKNGNKSMYMACSMAHRNNGRLVIMKGCSKYMWAGECYPGSNMYNRYNSFGAVEILADTLAESGYNIEGYDFRHLPGTTAIISDWEDFKSKPVRVDEYAGVEEMLISDQSFAGGVSDGKNGMFSAILKEHPKYNGTHRAIKSGFFVEDFLLFIGSDINNISEYPTETTLFQNFIGDKEADNTLTDIIGNIYYVPEGQNVEVRVENQSCPLSTDSGFAEGRYKTAVIKHGISPVDACYVYAVGIDGAPEKDYKIIRQDDVAHIAEVDGITFMAVFKPADFGGYKNILGVDIPVLIMINKKEELYICNPDLGLYDYDESQYDKDGNRIEVSIYSREWLGNEITSESCNLITAEKSYNLSLYGGRTYKIN